MIQDYIQTENYLLEICDEFKCGMRENYWDWIDFWEVDESIWFSDKF